MRKTLSLVLVLVLLGTFFAPSAGAVNVILNSAYLEFPDQEPVIVNGTTLVPIRPIAEALGLGVGWYEPTGTVTLKRNTYCIEFTIGSTLARSSSGSVTLSAAPTIINGRTMVPLRVISEALGLTVLWNDEYKRVVINGKIDTSTAAQTLEEKSSAVSGELPTGTVAEVETATEDVTELIDEVEDTNIKVEIPAPSGALTFALPETLVAEDVSDEKSFAYLTEDAADIQHTYDWTSTVFHESYADSDGKTGIDFISQELSPYEGDMPDVSRITESYPEKPEQPDIDWEAVQEEIELALMHSIFDERGVEMPENVLEMTEEELAAALKFDTVEEYDEYASAAAESFDSTVVPEVAEWYAYQEELHEYWTAFDELSTVKYAAWRNFSALSSQASDEAWAALFSEMLNSDPEVRYDGVEILTINGKKIVHATCYAEDPDDEQGTFDYYLYYDGDTEVTIYGGTLYASEPAPEIVDILSNMTIG